MDLLSWFLQYRYWLLLAALLLSVLPFIFLVAAAGHSSKTDEIRLRAIDRLPYGIYAFLALTGFATGGSLMI